MTYVELKPEQFIIQLSHSLKDLLLDEDAQIRIQILNPHAKGASRLTEIAYETICKALETFTQGAYENYLRNNESNP